MIISDSLTSHAGIFYDKEGQISISDGSWKLIVYKDIKPLFISFESLTRLSNNFQATSAQYQFLPNVQSTKSYLNVNLNKIESKLAELNMYLGKNFRVKRELLDDFGSVLKWLIGTPDAKDAKRYDECIDKLERNELDLSNLMQKQLQITSSTVRNFNETIFKITFDEQVINENINRLNSYLNKTDTLIFDIKVNEDISTISLQILELVTSLENEIDDCLASILFAKCNIVHPSIISSKKLFNELLKSNKIRTNRRLVTSVTTNNLHTLLDSSFLTAYVYSNRLVYILEFPLVMNDPLTLYHTYSIPIQHPNSSYYSTIIPEHIYLATNPSGQYYVSTSSLDNCITFAMRNRVCKDLVVYDSAERPICELQLLLSKKTTIPETCTATTFPAEIQTFQPLHHNRWLYILTTETSCVLHCDNEVSNHKLQGSGIVTLSQGCTLHTGYSTLSAYQSMEENATSPIIIPDIRTDDCFEITKNIEAPPHLLPIKINDMPLDSLNKIKTHLDKYSDELKKIQANSKSQSFLDRNNSTFMWFYFTIGIILPSYFLIKLCKRCPIGFNQTRRSSDGRGYVQIFNNCFDNSRRERSTHIAIPLRNIHQTSSRVTDDEEINTENPLTSPHSQRLGTNAQSLF